MRVGSFLLSLLSVLLLSTAPVYGSSPLTEESIIQQMKSRHPGFRVADEDRRAQQSELRQSEGAFDPVIRGQVLRSLDGPYGIY